MEIVVDGELTYKMKDTHPEIKEDKDIEKVRSYSDRFHIDTDRFFGTNHWMNHIRRELALVASGGYATKHIEILDIEVSAN